MQKETNSMTLLVQDILTDIFHNLEDLENNITVEDLKCLIEVESSIPVHEQALFFKNKELDNDMKKLIDCGVTNNDMITLTKKSNVQQKPKPSGGLNNMDKNLLDGFFTSVKKDISRKPNLTFNQMFNQVFHN
jgi:hypothetical protein